MQHNHLHRRHALAIPEPRPQPQPQPQLDESQLADTDADLLQSIVSIVYVTASKTFEGPIGGYITIGAPPLPPTPQDPVTTSAHPEHSQHAESTASTKADTSSAPSQSHTQSAAASSASQSHDQPSSTGLPASLVQTTSVASTIPLAIATSDVSETPSASMTNSAATTTPTAAASSGGMSVAGKAGLAIGILLIVGTALSLVLFAFRKRKEAQKAQQVDDEKTDLFGGPEPPMTTRTHARAPRLSLRPVTQFLPNLSEKPQIRGNNLPMGETPTAKPTTPDGWERPMLSQDANRQNPFDAHAEVDAVNARGPPIVNSYNPERSTRDAMAGAAGVGAGSVAIAGTIGLARGASKRENNPRPLDLTTGAGPFKDQPSPNGTEFSQTSDTATAPIQTNQSAAIAAAGGPSRSAVHRVQLDFKPSMDDELELHAGQLIRMLYEYDDGWALCVRLDRSQQGVVPRTCLSTRPVKPRPQSNGPPGPPPGMRVPQQGRPMSPAMSRGPPPQGRPQSPAMSHGNQSPMYAGGQGPMGPPGRGPRGPGPAAPQNQTRMRSGSNAQTQAYHPPPGPSPMSHPDMQPGLAVSSPLSNSPPDDPQGVFRKPVGQAF